MPRSICEDPDISSPNLVVRMGDPYASIGFTLKTAQQALRTHMDAALGRIGLTTPQYAVLNFLKLEPGASNAALARRAFVTPQTMQGIVVGLERDGLIKRGPRPEHGRVRTTELTKQGQAAWLRAKEIVAATEATLIAASAPIDPRILVETLRRLTDALRATDIQDRQI